MEDIDKNQLKYDESIGSMRVVVHKCEWWVYDDVTGNVVSGIAHTHPSAIAEAKRKAMRIENTRNFKITK